MIRPLILALTLGAAPAMAADVALVVGNGDYRNARDIIAGTEVMAAVPALQAAGFTVIRTQNADAASLRRAASDFLARADGRGRIVIVLSGHFARAGSQTWFLGTDTNLPDAISAGMQGIPLAVLLDIAARAPGQAVVLLGTEDRRIDLGEGLDPGIGPLAVPQGVAVIRGEADPVADFAAGPLLQRGQSLADALNAIPELAAEGFVSTAVPFLSAAATAPQPQPPVVGGGTSTADAERASFRLAQRQNTIASYEEHLRIWPNGANAAAARAAVDRLRAAADPAAQARAAEEALALTRDQRRQIQRDLTLLDFNPRGIDGVFGPGTRAAITAWQRANGAEANAFLTRDQITRISAQAARRAAELEAEAAARQAEAERRDRAFWAETGARGDEPGLRAYIDRFPDGLFADVARERLRPYDEARATQAAAADRAAWERARSIDRIEAYRAYLDEQARGAFRTDAEARIAALRQSTEFAEAARGEEALGLNQLTRNLIEARLNGLGLRPGRVDGVFDDDTRRAIRRYQQSRDMPVTGYLTQQTVVRLLADSVGIRLE